MANRTGGTSILDAIKSSISGATSAVSRIPQATKFGVHFGTGKLAGGLGRAIDVVGQALHNPLPEGHWSEKLENLGAQLVSKAYASDKGLPQSATEYRVGERVSQGKPISEADAGTAKRLGLNFTTEKSGILPQNEAAQKVASATNQAGQVVKPIEHLTVPQLQAMGLSGDLWNGQEIEVGGQRFKVIDNGDGTRTLQPIQQSSGGGNNGGGGRPSPEEVVSRVKQRDIAGVADDNTIQQILDDIYNKGMSIADAIEGRLKEAAEKRYQAMLGLLGQQKGEAKSLAEQQKQHSLEEEKFYKGELEKRRKNELETIEKQKEGAQKGYLKTKDEVAYNFRELVRKFEAQARAAGASVSGFTQGEERKILESFNKNLTKIALKNREMLNEFDRAIRLTNENFDSKISELEMKSRQYREKVDEWLKNQVAKIQAQEGMALADKYDAIANAVNKADAIRLNVEQSISQEKLAWIKWNQQLQLSMAQIANEAAMASSKKALDYYKAQLQELELQNKILGKQGLSVFYDKSGQAYLGVEKGFVTGGNPIGIPITEEQAQAIEQQKALDKILQGSSALKNVVETGGAGAQPVVNQLVNYLTRQSSGLGEQ